MVTKLHTSKVFFFAFFSFFFPPYMNIRVSVWRREWGGGGCCLRVAAGHVAGCSLPLLMLLLPLTNGPCNFLASISSHISALVNLFWRWVLKYAPLAHRRLLFHVTFPSASSSGRDFSSISKLVSHPHLWWMCGPPFLFCSVFSGQINLANMRP